MKKMIGRQHCQAFTLVEILVTVAILVVMMGFMFEFVLGAQKIWSGTTKNLDMFEQAQNIFGVMESDLKNMYCRFEDDNDEISVPVYLDTESGSGDKKNRLKRLIFMTSYQSSQTDDETGVDEETLIKRVGVYPVCYELVSINDDGNAPYKLYRYNYDRLMKAKTGTNKSSPYFMVGNTSTSNLFNEFKSYRNMNLDELDKIRELVSEDVETLQLQVFPSSSGELLEEKPLSFKLTVKLREKLDNPKKTPEKRAFSKIVFVN